MKSTFVNPQKNLWAHDILLEKYYAWMKFVFAFLEISWIFLG